MVRSRLIYVMSCMPGLLVGCAAGPGGKGGAAAGSDVLLGIRLSDEGKPSWEGLPAMTLGGGLTDAGAGSVQPPRGAFAAAGTAAVNAELRMGKPPSADTASAPPLQLAALNASDADLSVHTARGLASPAGGEVGQPPQSNELAQLRRALAEQQAAFQAQQQKLQAMERQIDRIAGGGQPVVGSPLPNQPAKTTVAASDTARGISPPPKKLPNQPVGKAPVLAQKPRAPELPRLSDTVGGVLTPKGKLVLEPSVEYAYSGNNRVFLDAFTFLPAIAVGLIDLRQVQQHTIIGAATGRFGITDYLEFTTRVPYLYRSDTQRSRPVAIGAGVDETFNAEGSGLGDIELTGRYQINGGTSGWPIMIANLTASLPTGKSPYDVEYVQAQGVPGAQFPTELPMGSGFFSLQPSVTALYPTDPAVFYGSLSYSYNMETNERAGTIDPGDALGGSFGLGFSMNEKASFSLGYSQKHVFNTRINGSTLSGTTLDIGEFLLGYAYKFTPNTNINLSLGIGATPDAQDIKMTLRLPTYFDVM
jgi:hypothetical protein